MTRREQNLWIVVGLAISITAIYYFSVNRNHPPVNQDSSSGTAVTVNLEEAYHLLQKEQNINRRQKAVSRIRARIETEFIGADDPKTAGLVLLGLIENMAATAGLSIDQKNIAALKNDFIAVSLEGKTGSSSLFRFMQLIAGAKVNLEIHRLQIHALIEQKMLNYQIVVSTLLISKRGKSGG